MTTDYKRLFVRELKWTSEDASGDFFAALKAACRARITETKDGQMLVGTMGNGRSVSFRIPTGDTRQVNPTLIAELCGELLGRYDTAQAALVASGIPTPTDAQIYAELYAGLDEVTESYFDASEIRLPNNFAKLKDTNS